jgi:hypothetical protein
MHEKKNRLFYIIRSGNRNHEMVKKREKEISEECIIIGTENKWKHAHVVKLKKKTQINENIFS